MSAQAYSSDVAFTPSVKAVQARKGSRRSYARIEERGGWQTRWMRPKPPFTISAIDAR